MSDIKLLVRMCYIEHVPIEESRFQQAVRAMGMDAAADRLSYEIELPLGDDLCTTSSLKSGIPSGKMV